jgi:hypothetical protein
LPNFKGDIPIEELQKLQKKIRSSEKKNNETKLTD